MRHEEIQRVYPNHYYLSHKNMGGAGRLVGKVDVIVFFVNDSRSAWTERSKMKYRETQKAAMQYILKNARSKGVDLQLRNAYIDTTVPMECTLNNYREWSQAVMANFKKSSILSFQQNYKAAHQCAEAPIIFVLNKPFRSSAVSARWETRLNGEMSILSSNFDMRTIVHELLHQFGAVDFYYPKEVSDLLQRMRYSSVMGAITGLTIDSLTSYLIGWTQEIDAPAVKILEHTKHFTREYMNAVIRREYQNP